MTKDLQSLLQVESGPKPHRDTKFGPFPAFPKKGKNFHCHLDKIAGKSTTITQRGFKDWVFIKRKQYNKITQKVNYAPTFQLC